MDKTTFDISFEIISAGVQRRKIECYWGGHKCLGYKNEEETQPFCSYGGFLDSFCDTNWSILPTRQDNFLFNRISGSGKKKSSDYACKRLGSGRRGCLPTQIANTKVMIQICDSSKAWTKWTRESSAVGWNSDKYYFR